MPADKLALIRDYEVFEATGGAGHVLAHLAGLPDQALLEFDELAAALGYPRTVNPMDYAVAPRGYRVLSKVPRLPDHVIDHVVGHFSGLEAFLRAIDRGSGGGRRRRQRPGRVRSGRVCGACRSRTWSTATSTCELSAPRAACRATRTRLPHASMHQRRRGWPTGRAPAAVRLAQAQPVRSPVRSSITDRAITPSACAPESPLVLGRIRGRP